MEPQTDTNLTELLSGNEYRPEAVLIAYKQSNCYRGGHYLEVRQVLSDGRLGAARPVSRKFMESLTTAYSDAKTTLPHGVVPDNLMYENLIGDTLHMVWWNPPQKRLMSFSKNINLQDGEYNVPGIIYSLKGTTLSVYAFDGKKPSKVKPLRWYPSFNQYEDHHICLGSSKLEYEGPMEWALLMRHWENIFWSSINTSVMSRHIGKENLTLLYKEAADKPFDIAKCEKLNLSLKNLMS